MTQQMIDVLITNGLIVRVQDFENQNTRTGNSGIIENASIAVHNGKIIRIGSTQELEKFYLADTIIDAGGKAILPGFVDTHHHFLQHYLKGPRDDVDLPQWIKNVSAPVITKAVRDYKKGNNEMQLYATRFGCLEALKMGITTILNMEWATHPDVMDVYDETGIRAVHTLTLTDIDEWNNPDMLLPIPQALELAENLIQKTKQLKKQRVVFRYGLADEICCTPELIQKVRERADTDDVGIHMHMAETTRSVEKIKKQYDKSPVAFLYDLGLLKPDVLGAHCIWMNAEDMDRMAETGATVSHNPEANAKVSEGIAPIAEMLKRGITVSLGTDTVAANDNMDMFEAMRMAAFLQKVSTYDPTTLPAYATLHMATVGGARALGMQNEIGSIEEGKKADLILVDIDSLHMQPRNNLINNLVYCASAAANVDTVIVEGDVIVKDREFINFDEKEEIQRFTSFASELFKTLGRPRPFYY